MLLFLYKYRLKQQKAALWTAFSILTIFMLKDNQGQQVYHSQNERIRKFRSYV